MKIAIDVSQIIYGTGVSVYTRNLVTQLIKMYPEDEFILFGGSLRRMSDLKTFSHRLRATPKFFPLPPSFLDLIWNSFHVLPIEKLIGNVDVVHTSDWSEPPSRLPKVTTVHDLISLLYPTNKIHGTHRRRLTWVSRESDAIIAVSQATKRDLEQELKIEPNLITVTPEGVESFYKPQPPALIDSVKKKYDLRGDYLFCLSTLEPRKNQKRLIQAFQIVRERYPNLKLVLGGRTGWGDIDTQSEGVLLAGYVPDADLPALYSGSLAYVLPSLYEGFSLSHLQAMACGASVVGSNISSMPEVIGHAGVLVNPQSVESISVGIIRAIENRTDFGPKAIKRAAIFTWEETAKLTHQVYQSVLRK